MDNPEGKSTRRLLLEGSAIVLSILIAFGLDAAWEERGERVREREAIERLTDEFEVVQTRLITLDSVYEHGRFSGAAPLRELLGVMGSERGSFSDGRLDSLLASPLGNPRVNLPEGVLSALIASGEFALVQSDSLRAALAGYEPLRDIVKGDLSYAATFNAEQMLPFLWENSSVRALDVNTRYHVELGLGPFDRDHWPLLQSRTFENLINERLTMLEAGSERLSETLTHVQLVLRLLRAEIDD